MIIYGYDFDDVCYMYGCNDDIFDLCDSIVDVVKWKIIEIVLRHFGDTQQQTPRG